MDDYRLLPGSPALHPGRASVAGAFPQVPADYQAPPTIRVSAGSMLRAQLPLTLAVESSAPARKMRYTINDRKAEEQAFTATVTLQLPNEEKTHTVRVQVQDADGAWSKESVVRVAGASSQQPSKPPAAPPLAERRPRMLYVAPDGADVEDAGARDRPFRTIQYVLDRAAADDRVRIKPGVYFGANRIENRAGTPERPLVIEGLYPNTAILDGLDETGTLLRIEDSPNVIVRNLNFRWYVGQGIVIVNSKGARVTGCRFQNQYWRGGADVEGRPALLFLDCPEFTADHCIFTRTRYQLEFRESPGGQVLHNTFVAGAVTHILWRGAATEGIAIKYNSINWNGNQMLNVSQPLDVLKHGIVIDGNNYGTTFQKPEGTETPRGAFGKSLPKPFRYLPSNREYLVYEDTTDPAEPTSHAFVNMKDWQEFSGQDKHSIFADPKWIDPKAGRFDVAADSPNLLPDGTIIGALGYLGENPTVPPEVVVTAPCSGEEVRGALTITAEASDYDGKVQKVEFYADGRLLGTATTAPYRLEDVKLIPGKHAIAVKAFDDRDATTVSDEVRVIAGECPSQ
ncbi:Ig-like domain-containing protein [Planctomycetota bacterium]